MINFRVVFNVFFLLLFVAVGFFVYKSFIDYNHGKIPNTGNLSEQNNLNTSAAEFNQPILLNIDQSITFIDGLNLKLKSIDDSRCKPEVVCVWQGELSALFVPSSIDNSIFGEVRLGTVKNVSVTLNGYIFTLKSATENTATIVVSK